MKPNGEIGQAVSAAQYKRAVDIVPTDTASDDLIDFYLQAAQEVVETACRRSMLPRDVVFEVQAKALARWFFPVAPVSTLGDIEVQDAAGDWVAVDASGVVLQFAFDEPQLKLPDGGFPDVAPGAALRIAATIGQADTIPRGMVQAVILTVKEWFDAGVSIEAGAPVELSFGALRLIKQARYVRPAEWAVE